MPKRTVESYLAEADEYAAWGQLIFDFDMAELTPGSYAIYVNAEFVYYINTSNVGCKQMSISQHAHHVGTDKAQLIEDATQDALKRLFPKIRNIKNKVRVVCEMFEEGKMKRVLK